MKQIRIVRAPCDRAACRAPQTKGFGLYLMSIIIVVLVSGLAHFAALAVLHGKILQPGHVDNRATTVVLTVAVAQFRSDASGAGA